MEAVFDEKRVHADNGAEGQNGDWVEFTPELEDDVAADDV